MYESIQNGEQKRVFRSLVQVANIIRITAKTTTFDRHIGVAGDVKSCTKIESGTNDNQRGDSQIKTLCDVRKNGGGGLCKNIF